ncbi:hypothetical protein IFM89_013012 [Coptis chinensis]|uniref:Uncharacterized protein n=1 Tax=Coptis chinensis TaxID=261450 RepID=A0A835LAT8_9MAGN|nr:hypothetical protein IFM89_013012 [Coptis chinensis]
MAFIPPCNIYGSPLSDEEKEVYSKILDYQIHFHGEPRDLTCKFVARAYCQIRASKSKDVAVIFDDFDCMDLLLQLAHALLYLSEISRRVDAYNEVLTDISSVKLKPKKKDGIIRDVQSLVEGNLLGETGHEILQVVNQVFELNEADFKQIRNKVLDSFVAPKLGEKTKVVVDAQTQKINRSIRELYDQVEDDCSDDDEKIFGDEDEYFKNQIDALCSLVRFIFKHPIMEVETVAAILPYYPGFRQLGQEMMKYESDCICDSLIEGLFDGSCDCSTFQELWCPPGENSASSKFKWILCILKKILSLDEELTSCYEMEYGLTRPEYVKIVTADGAAKINSVSHNFASTLVPCGEPCNISKCEHVVRKSLLSMVRHHKSMKLKFLMVRQELIAKGKHVLLDAEHYDTLLFLIAYIRQLESELTRGMMILSNRIDYVHALSRFLFYHEPEHNPFMVLMEELAKVADKVHEVVQTSYSETKNMFMRSR